MSLQKKIEQEMNDLAIQIIRRVQWSPASDLKVKKMCLAYFDLKRLLGMANSVVEIDKNVSKETAPYVAKDEL